MHRYYHSVLLAALFPALLISEGPSTEDAKAPKAASVELTGRIVGLPQEAIVAGDHQRSNRRACRGDGRRRFLQAPMCV